MRLCNRICKLVCSLMLGLFMLSVWPSSPAYADEFKTHYDLALALYQAQKFEESIPEFKAAHAITPKPGLLFNIAQAYRKAGHPREAIDYYERYLSSEPQLNDETHRKVDSYLTEARNTLTALELEMKQRLAEEKAAREKEPPPLSPTSSPPPVAISPQTGAQPSAVDATAPRPVYKRWWFWTVVGAGVVAVAVGVGLGVGLGGKTATPTVPDHVSLGTITSF